MAPRAEPTKAMEVATVLRGSCPLNQTMPAGNIGDRQAANKEENTQRMIGFSKEQEAKTTAEMTFSDSSKTSKTVGWSLVASKVDSPLPAVKAAQNTVFKLEAPSLLNFKLLLVAKE